MNLSSLKDLYALIPSQHRTRTNFRKWLAALWQPFIDLRDCAAQMIPRFDLDQAVDMELEAIGLWVGAPRRVGIAIEGVWFTWDSNIAEEQWDMGFWWQPGDGTVNQTRLPDDLYRRVIRAKIIANHNIATRAIVAQCFSAALPDAGAPTIIEAGAGGVGGAAFTVSFAPALAGVDLAIANVVLKFCTPAGVQSSII